MTSGRKTDDARSGISRGGHPHFLDPESTLPGAGKIRWNTLLDLAKAHAVTPMLYAALREAPLPDDIAAELRARFQSSVQWSLA